jgi:putative ABC transport system permease protein
MGLMSQPLSGFDSITGLALDDFRRLNAGFRYLQGGPLVNDNDLIVDEYYAQQKHLRAGDNVNMVNHDWRLVGIFESGKLARVCVKLQVLQTMTGNPGHLSQISLKSITRRTRRR